MDSVVTVNNLLDGHVGLDLECLDRIYLNGYVPTLQVAGQVFTFLTRHLGKPIASPAVFEQIGDRFRRAMASQKRWELRMGMNLLSFFRQAPAARPPV